MKPLNTLILAASVLAGLSFTACSKAPTAKVQTPAPTAKVQTPAPMAEAQTVAAIDDTVKAVLIYADWCGSCKVLDPMVQALRPGFDDMGVSFVKLDYTAKDADAFFTQATDAGVHTAVHSALSDSIKTGQLLIVSADGTQVISTLNKTNSKDEILDSLMKAVSEG